MSFDKFLEYKPQHQTRQHHGVTPKLVFAGLCVLSLASLISNFVAISIFASQPFEAAVFVSQGFVFMVSLLSLTYTCFHCLAARRNDAVVKEQPFTKPYHALCFRLARSILLLWFITILTTLVAGLRPSTCHDNAKLCRLQTMDIVLSILAFISTGIVLWCLEASEHPFEAPAFMQKSQVVTCRLSEFSDNIFATSQPTTRPASVEGPPKLSEDGGKASEKGSHCLQCSNDHAVITRKATPPASTPKIPGEFPRTPSTKAQAVHVPAPPTSTENDWGVSWKRVVVRESSSDVNQDNANSGNAALTAPDCTTFVSDALFPHPSPTQAKTVQAQAGVRPPASAPIPAPAPVPAPAPDHLPIQVPVAVHVPSEVPAHPYCSARTHPHAPPSHHQSFQPPPGITTNPNARENQAQAHVPPQPYRTTPFHHRHVSQPPPHTNPNPSTREYPHTRLFQTSPRHIRTRSSEPHPSVPAHAADPHTIFIPNPITPRIAPPYIWNQPTPSLSPPMAAPSIARGPSVPPTPGVPRQPSLLGRRPSCMPEPLRIRRQSQHASSPAPPMPQVGSKPDLSVFEVHGLDISRGRSFREMRIPGAFVVDDEYGAEDGHVNQEADGIETSAGGGRWRTMGDDSVEVEPRKREWYDEMLARHKAKLQGAVERAKIDGLGITDGMGAKYPRL